MAMGDEKSEQDCRKVVVEAAHWVSRYAPHVLDCSQVLIQSIFAHRFFGVISFQVVVALLSQFFGTSTK